MFEILLDPNGAPLDPRLPAHDAIRNIVRRCVGDVEDCGCAVPWRRVSIAECWREGRLAISGIQACCTAQERAALQVLPAWMITLEKVRNAFPPPPPTGLRASMRFLLEDVRDREGRTIAEGTEIIPVLLPGATDVPLRGQHDSVVFRHEAPCEIDGALPRSLLIRPLYHSPNLVKSLSEFRPFEVVGYWRYLGLDWTPASVFAAEHLSMGVAGSFTARLTRLFPDSVPDEGRLRELANG